MYFSINKNGVYTFPRQQNLDHSNKLTELEKLGCSNLTQRVLYLRVDTYLSFHILPDLPRHGTHQGVQPLIGPQTPCHYYAIFMYVHF